MVRRRLALLVASAMATAVGWSVASSGGTVGSARQVGGKAVDAQAAQAQPRTSRLAMSDGVRLATDVYLPAGRGPFPVILMRTPYNKDRQRRGGLAAAKLGYAVVVQDMRGRFASEGENVPFIGCGWGKHRDGAETVAWILAQPWCNGKVGTRGGSAGGITQNLLAGAAPAGLTAQYITVAAASLYHHAAYVGGALRESQMVGWLTEHRFDSQAVDLYRRHRRYDAFWHPFDSTRRHAVMTVPAVHVGGWFDTFSQGTIDSFVGRQHNGAEGAKGTQKLVMGPWAHRLGRKDKVGELRFPDAAAPTRYSPIRWFDCTLKGIDNGMMDEPAVAYYVMGDVGDPKAPGNEWRYGEDWPIPATRTPYYLHPGGRLSTAPPAKGRGQPAHVEYTFDPANPCPTVGGRNLNLPAGPMDQRAVEQRRDVLTFTTGPLPRPVEVTGRVWAKIYVASSAVDTDLSVRLCDVYPDGKSYLMAEGMLRLRLRRGFQREKPLQPGQTYEVMVDCWSTSIVFNQGHRIRVSVTSSNHPRFDLNPGTGEIWRKGCRFVRQTNRIFCDGVRPSQIVLPVVKARQPER